MDTEAENFSQDESDPHFFRKVGHQTIEAGALEIPEKFVGKYGSCLSKYACLEINTGKMWKVELKKCDGRVWLHKGWKEFVDNCNIKCGYSLAFRYEGGSFFHVLVFDSTRLEIDYSASTNQRVNLDQPEIISVVKKEGISDDSSLVILNECPQKSNEVPLANQSNDEVLQGEGPSPPSARDGVVQRAREFHTSHPYFIFTMGPTYHTSLCIPESSARSYFHGRGDNRVYLNGPDGKAWLMNYVVGGPPQYDINIYAGWSKFVEEYHLQDGDTCIFELINNSVMVFNVTVFKDFVEVADVPNPTQTGTSGTTALERAKCMQCDKPSFVAPIKNLYHLCIPLPHASRYLVDQHEKDVFLHGLDGETWSVKCYLYGNTVRRFSAGWKKFVSGNDLQIGDVCVFELLSQAPHHYHVTIFRATKSAKPN